MSHLAVVFLGYWSEVFFWFLRRVLSMHLQSQVLKWVSWMGREFVNQSTGNRFSCRILCSGEVLFGSR
jgi:hypothetical protein